MATDVMSTLAAGPILVAYALLLGAGPIITGIVGNIEFIGNLFYFVSSYLIQKGKSAKNISIFSASISRPFYLIIALLSFFPKNNIMLSLFIVSVFFAYGVSAIGGGAFYPWMKSLLVKRIMTPFFAERYRWMMVADIFALLFSAGWIFLFKQIFPEQIIYAYAFLIALAFVFGTISILNLIHVKDAKVEIANTGNFLNTFLKAFKDRHFFIFCLFMSFVNFSTSFVTPFLTVFMLKQNKLEMPLIIILTIFSQLAYVFSTQFWKKYAQNKGCIAMLNKGCVLYIGIVLMFSLTVKLPLLPLIIILFLGHILLGYAKFAIKLGTNNLPLFYVPNKNSSIYLSFVNIFRACGSLVSGILSGILLLGLQNFIKNDQVSWLVFFAFSICLFLVAIRISKYVREEK